MTSFATLLPAMRTAFCGSALMIGMFPGNAQGPVINEVQSHGAPGDIVELYNPTPTELNLEGMTLTMGTLRHRLPPCSFVPAFGFLVLRSMETVEGAPGTLPWKLPREGATLLLLNADRTVILDGCTYPPMPSGWSLARWPDGGERVVFLDRPTPGGTNCTSPPSVALPQSPVPVYHHDMDGTTSVSFEVTDRTGCRIHYTTDGRAPDGDDPHAPDRLPIAPGGPIIARSCNAEGVLSPSLCIVLPRAPDPLPAWTLVVDPDDLWDHQRGIDVDGAAANFSRRGAAWKRQGRLAGPLDTIATDVTVRVAGSGSRSLAKRSYRAKCVGDPPLSWPFDTRELLLRADAQPHAAAHNLFMEILAGHAGGRVDVLPSRPIELFINDGSRGMYRIMPARTSGWLGRAMPDVQVEVVDGSSDGDASARAALDECIARLREGASPDTLTRHMDLASLVEMACFDLYTGRADHDLNACAWRPRSADGRWRWVMHDMDLWSNGTDNSVDLFSSAAVPEPPFVAEILAHDSLRTMLLHRIQVLLHTLLSPAMAHGLLDSLHAQLFQVMRKDHDLWHDSLDVPAPEATFQQMALFVDQRPEHLLTFLAAHTHRRLRDQVVRVEPAGAGWVEWDGLRLGQEHLRVFHGIPLRLQARASEGMEFLGWRERPEESAEIVIKPGRRPLVAVFGPAGRSYSNGL